MAGVSKDDVEEATKWIGSLDRIHRARGIQGCFDLTATPFAPTGKKSGQETLFTIISDFGLNDAIESGLVKTPRVVVRDDGAWVRDYRSKFYHLDNPYPSAQGGANVPGFNALSHGHSQLISLRTREQSPCSSEFYRLGGESDLKLRDMQSRIKGLTNSRAEARTKAERRSRSHGHS